MGYRRAKASRQSVTPRKGRVDWNVYGKICVVLLTVTPRKGRVDWNFSCSVICYFWDYSHAPQGACGLKFDCRTVRLVFGCHAPQGACGLKWFDRKASTKNCIRHAPQGACGLKFRKPQVSVRADESRPARGVWIEICPYRDWCAFAWVTPRKGRVDWNCLLPSLFWVKTCHAPQGACGLKWRGYRTLYLRIWSRPARGVWIEIFLSWAKRNGRVDWNLQHLSPCMNAKVTPRKGRVDWNPHLEFIKSGITGHAPQGACGLKWRGSEQGGDIEGHAPQGACGSKCCLLERITQAWRSRPARGVWIEIIINKTKKHYVHVTPRKGRVDWNLMEEPKM